MLYTAILLLAQAVPGELVVSQPTLATPCTCAQGGACVCGDDCRCVAAKKPTLVSVLAEVTEKPKLTNREAEVALKRLAAPARPVGSGERM